MIQIPHRVQPTNSKSDSQINSLVKCSFSDRVSFLSIEFWQKLCKPYRIWPCQYFQNYISDISWSMSSRVKKRVYRWEKWQVFYFGRLDYIREKLMCQLRSNSKILYAFLILQIELWLPYFWFGIHLTCLWLSKVSLDSQFINFAWLYCNSDYLRWSRR